ncbi:hypothetical protein MQE36_08015 [Zhouia spongiae]|uniref:Uncharacterized protein n=1 Tax=Zhouia spongiae TaxID=2202721 RepID=A0ABY3YR28_9FLAO|nr:hypothetical protein [Zhouia spongiae]UNZ00273.1 hypothetical protein MQE36_08015 [Zhouia spongiae]
MKTKFNLLILILLSTGLNAQDKIQELQSLVDMKATYLDQEMSKNGYYHIKSQKSDDDIYEYWWNSNKKKCACTRVSDGRVQSVVGTLPADCNKTNTANRTDYSRHSNYHHDNGHHSSNNDEDNAFERGYNDGQYHKNFHNIYSSNIEINAYSRGYTAGSKQRNHNTSYHSGRAGNHPHVKVDDLNNWLASSAYDELKARGFELSKQHDSNGRHYKYWWNDKTRQCIRTTAVNDNIVKVENSGDCVF